MSHDVEELGCKHEAKPNVFDGLGIWMKLSECDVVILCVPGNDFGLKEIHIAKASAVEKKGVRSIFCAGASGATTQQPPPEK